MTRTRDLALAALAALSFVGAVAAGGADLGAGAARRGVPLGVDPARAARFQGETFVCDGGAVSLPFSRVNDDYCDCADGADEPGTSACSNGSFHCRNRGHQPVNVPSSRVGDGVCDCCDGSDERASKKSGAACANTCAGAGASRRDALRRELSDHRAGLGKKATLINAAPAERKRWMEKRERLARDAAAASAAADEAAAPNYAYQAAALFVSGYAALRQGGASQEAKPKLSRALKLAHSQCCNHQLVAQSLSLIGTVVLDTRGGDLGQSLDMLQSSFTLSKAQEDMPAQLGCLGGLLRLHRLRGSPEEEQSALTSYRRRKLGAYEALVAAAADDEARLVRLAAGGLEPAGDVVAMDADCAT